MRYTQAAISQAVDFFADDIRARFDLAEYRSASAPTVFFGCYDQSDLDRLLAHRGPRLLIWRGTDATRRRMLLATKSLLSCRHIAISGFIAHDLENVGIRCFRLPVTGRAMGAEFAPCPKGEAIHVYTGSAERAGFYGLPLVQQLMERFPDIEFILCEQNSFPREVMADIYRRCFLGLRLVAHDGLSNTVVELGLMGRKTVHNGGLPGSLAWRTLEDVCAHIRRERAMIGTTDGKTADMTRAALRLPGNWLDTRYYEGIAGWWRSRSVLR